MKKSIIIILLLIYSTVSFSQGLNDKILKANWIFIIADNVTFPNQDKIDTFKIAIFGRNSEVYSYAKKLEKEKTIQGKPVKIENITKIQNLINYNIVYLDESKNDFVETIFTSIKDQAGILLITYRNKNKDYIMINLLLKDKDNQFQIQSSNLFDSKIVASDKLMSLGGNKIDLQGLYDKKEKQLKQKQEQLEKQEQLLVQKQKQLEELSKELEKQRIENEKQSELLKKQTAELEKQKKNAQQLLEQVAQQTQVLQQNKYILNNLNQEIAEKQKLIKAQNDSLEKKKDEVQKKQDELKIQEGKITEQKKVLAKQVNKIETQSNIITITAIFVVIVLILLLLVIRAFTKNKKITKQLRQKNTEIELQKDELKKQALQLEEYNKELEKLSLVASKTDNSVIIMDKKGHFEWINSGFTRMYGYTLQLLIQENGNSLLDVGDTEKKRRILNECLTNKKTVTYQAKNKTRVGDEIWVQTSLTPVINENDEITKLIAIESNITKIKEQEYEIKQKNDELTMQKAELETQKELLEEINKQVRDSINYAQTIQNAILPLEKDVSAFFNHFLVFLPRDIVSGDFYWFANPKPGTFYFAAVDCTGHGVPGSFMSLISLRMLEEAVIFRQIWEPGKILTQLNNAILKSLSQKDTNNRDGMDLALIKVDKLQNNKFNITFSGAKRPLIYYDKTDLNIIKGNRRSIGGITYHPNFDFTQEELEMEKGDILYLTTDGIIDQNNKLRKRFGSQRFWETLLKIKDLPLDEQKIEIIKRIEEFKGDEMQRDDITVWGIQL